MFSASFNKVNYIKQANINLIFLFDKKHKSFFLSKNFALKPLSILDPNSERLRSDRFTIERDQTQLKSLIVLNAYL